MRELPPINKAVDLYPHPEVSSLALSFALPKLREDSNRSVQEREFFLYQFLKNQSWQESLKIELLKALLTKKKPNSETAGKIAERM